MSYEEKRTWVYLVASAAAYGVYLVIVLERALHTPIAQVPYVPALLWTTVASIVTAMVGRVAIETETPRFVRHESIGDHPVDDLLDQRG